MGSDAGCGVIKPALNIVIQNRPTSHLSRYPMYGGHVRFDRWRHTRNLAKGRDPICTWTSKKRPTPVHRRLSLTQDVLGKPIPRGLELALGMKRWSTNVRLEYSALHL